MNQTEPGESRSVGGLDTKDQFKFEHKRPKKIAWMRPFERGLDHLAEAYEQMHSGKVRFRVVLTFDG